MTLRAREKICVYCSSSDAVKHEYFYVAADLGTLMACKNYDLVYGGGAVGLMGELAKAVQRNGGSVYAIMPEKLHKHGIGYSDAEEFIVTKDMRERKALMEEKASAFIALPGGLGTLEELSEILTLKQLAYHNKPVVMINANGFFDPLLRFFDTMEKGRFIKPDCRKLYHVAADPVSALEYIASYKPQAVDAKWFFPASAGGMRTK